MHSRKHTCTHTHIQTHTSKHTHLYTHIQTHIYTLTCTHTHTHNYTNIHLLIVDEVPCCTTCVPNKSKYKEKRSSSVLSTVRTGHFHGHKSFEHC